MDYSISLSSESDDSDTEYRPSTSKKKINIKNVSIVLTSDSDSEREITTKKKRVKPKKEIKKAKTFGKIDLITSDEDSESDKVPKKISEEKKNVDIMDLLTSDEESSPNGTRKTKKLPQKRKITNSDKISEKRQKLIVINTENVEKSTGHTQDEPLWKNHELLCEIKNLTPQISKNLVDLFESGNTIPFIARYRKNVTGNMSPEAIRDVKDSYDEICEVRHKMATVIKTIRKQGKLDAKLEQGIKSARTFEEIEYFYAPFKVAGKRTLAEKAKDLGLESPAVELLQNVRKINLEAFVNPEKSELKRVGDVEKGIMHVIASIIASDTEMLKFLRQVRNETNFTIETKKCLIKSETKQKPEKKQQFDNTKYENYYDFKIPVKHIKPHQVLAINRGESQKALTVKVNIPESVFHRFMHFCYNKWMKKSPSDDYRKKIIDQAVGDAYTRLVQPLLIREIRSELKVNAEKASCEVFSTNLKHLLLTSPLKGKAILGIDPGYTNGCKLALISSTGSLLEHSVVYPHNKSYKNKGEDVLQKMMLRHKCDLIALGNGTACRETEEWLCKMIEKRIFGGMDVKYTIINEDGASIYSCSPEARKEFADLDPNIISAVSLARRVQDPMAELVKVDPAHLGVGMYQHDLKKKLLDNALSEVVSECVSFVGVDLNTASQCLLRRVAGLSDKRATQIIDYREKNGPFITRNDLLDVYGIGRKVFEQCAGFLRVGPTDPQRAIHFYKNDKTTKLDSTIIHPESYDLAEKIIDKFGLKVMDIGEPRFISTVRAKTTEKNVEDLANETCTNQETVRLVLDALGRPLDHDLRNEGSKEPLFRKGLKNIAELKVGMVLTGRVQNSTHFGCFVDIGVGTNGLIHTSRFNGVSLQINDRVEVKVVDLDLRKKHVSLEVVRKLG